MEQVCPTAESEMNERSLVTDEGWSNIGGTACMTLAAVAPLRPPH